MPNHVMHRISVTGAIAALAAFKAAHFVTIGGKATLDFNTIITRPAILDGTVNGSESSFGYELITEKPYPNGFRQSSILTLPWVQEYGCTTIESLCSYLRRVKPLEHKEYIHAGALAVEAEKETGFPSWYEWSIAKWGTKWNAYSFEIEHDEPESIEFTFNTAWSVPEPVLEALAAAHPDLTFDIAAFDECWNFAWTGNAEKGVLEGETVEANDDLYERVYGFAPESDDELSADEAGDANAVIAATTAH